MSSALAGWNRAKFPLNVFGPLQPAVVGIAIIYIIQRNHMTTKLQQHNLFSPELLDPECMDAFGISVNFYLLYQLKGNFCFVIILLLFDLREWMHE